MKSVLIIVQRDLLGAIAEYTLMLVDDQARRPLTTAETMGEALTLARAAMTERSARGIRIEDG